MSVCGACLGTKQVTRYKSAGYDQATYSFKTPCPLCSQAKMTITVPVGGPGPFPMIPAKGRN